MITLIMMMINNIKSNTKHNTNMIKLIMTIIIIIIISSSSSSISIISVTIQAGSLFARLQSLGAKGLSTATKFEVSGASNKCTNIYIYIYIYTHTYNTYNTYIRKHL